MAAKLGVSVGQRVFMGSAVAVGTEVDVDVLVDAAVGVDKGGAWSELQASDTKIKVTTANQTEFKRFFFIAILLFQFRGYKYPLYLI